MMSSLPILSIVIPAFNIRQFVRDAVQSALSQTVQDLEVIVVDDGSTDGSMSAIEDCTDSRLIIVRQENRGLPGARNVGLAVAKGRFVGFLDGDDIWVPDKAAQHLAIMERDPRIGLTYSFSAYLHEDGRPTGHLLKTRCMRPTLAEIIERNHLGNGSSFIMRAECLEETGPFDERLTRGGEDQEMGIRVLAKTAYSCVCIPEPLTGYRIRKTSMTHDFERVVQGWLSSLETARGYCPQVPEHVFKLAAAGSYRIMARKAISAGNRSVAWSLFRRALAETPRILFSDSRTLATLAFIALPRFLSPSGLNAYAAKPGSGISNSSPM